MLGLLIILIIALVLFGGIGYGSAEGTVAGKGGITFGF